MPCERSIMERQPWWCRISGRQLDYAPASLTTLPEVYRRPLSAEVIDGRRRRRGSDIVKAICLGVVPS